MQAEPARVQVRCASTPTCAAWLSYNPKSKQQTSRSGVCRGGSGSVVQSGRAQSQANGSDCLRAQSSLDYNAILSALFLPRHAFCRTKRLVPGQGCSCKGPCQHAPLPTAKCRQLLRRHCWLESPRPRKTQGLTLLRVVTCMKLDKCRALTMYHQHLQAGGACKLSSPAP